MGKENYGYAINHLEKELRRLSWLARNKPNDYLAKNIESVKNAISKLSEGAKKPTGIKDRNGTEIFFGDRLRFADKVEWYRGSYNIKVLTGEMTRQEALKEIENQPYEEREVKDVEDYEWLLSSDVPKYWEVIKNNKNELETS